MIFYVLCGRIARYRTSTQVKNVSVRGRASKVYTFLIRSHQPISPSFRAYLLLSIKALGRFCLRMSGVARNFPYNYSWNDARQKSTQNIARLRRIGILRWRSLINRSSTAPNEEHLKSNWNSGSG